MTNPTPTPVRSSADLGWIEAKISALYKTRSKGILAPERDAAGLQGHVGWRSSPASGRCASPATSRPTAAATSAATFWDFQMDPREERKRRIDLSTPRYQSNKDGALTIVEYADMECGYCKYRGLQMDSLLEANAKTLSYKRYYKFFPLWFNHAWSMKAASAADCLFRFAGAADVRVQEARVRAAGDHDRVGHRRLALTEAEAAGVPAAGLPRLLPARGEPGERAQATSRRASGSASSRRRPTSSTEPRSPGSRTP